jgi:hypothetical protein
MGICKLCLQERELITKSHIVPKFMYKDGFDDLHRIVSIRKEGGKLIPQKPLSQDSLYEPDLLCDDCEKNILSKRYEDYFSKKLYYHVKKFAKTLPCPEYLKIVSFPADYQRIKLFFLSILWRYSILQKPENPPIYLGEHQEIIREMILKNNPKEIYDYPFYLICSLNKDNYNKDNNVTKWSSGPQLINIYNSFPYQTFFPGFVLLMWISNAGDGPPPPYNGDHNVLVGYSSGDIEKIMINYWLSNIDFESLKKHFKKKDNKSE